MFLSCELIGEGATGAKAATVYGDYVSRSGWTGSPEGRVVGEVAREGNGVGPFSGGGIGVPIVTDTVGETFMLLFDPWTVDTRPTVCEIVFVTSEGKAIDQQLVIEMMVVGGRPVVELSISIQVVRTAAEGPGGGVTIEVPPVVSAA